MKPRDIFHIIIAAVGLILFFYGVLYLFDGVSFVLGLADPPLHYTPKWYAVRGGFEMVLGLFVMRGLPMFLDLAFPEDIEKKSGSEKRDEDSKRDE